MKRNVPTQQKFGTRPGGKTEKVRNMFYLRVTLRVNYDLTAKYTKRVTSFFVGKREKEEIFEASGFHFISQGG